MKKIMFVCVVLLGSMMLSSFVTSEETNETEEIMKICGLEEI